MLEKTCCMKALKHGQSVCPVCGEIFYVITPKCDVINKLKTMMFIPFIALSLHSCKGNTDTGVVKHKLDNRVYLSPMNDTTVVNHCINFEAGYKNEFMEKLYQHINVGDTIVFSNDNQELTFVPAYPFGEGAKHIKYNIVKVNGKSVKKLQQLIKTNKHEYELKQLNLDLQKRLQQQQNGR